MCAQCTFSQGPEGASFVISSSDINPSSPSNGTPIAAPCCESEPSKAGFQGCTCTKETLGCSIHPSTRDAWIVSQRASLVRIFQRQEKARESTGREAGSSPRSSCQLSLCDLDSSFLRTAKTSSPVALASFSGRLPQSGLMRSGAFVPLKTLERPTSASVGGALRGVPTPTVCGNHNRKGASAQSGDGLATFAKKWPAPRATDGSHGGRVTPRKSRNGGNLIEAVSAASYPTPTASMLTMQGMEQARFSGADKRRPYYFATPTARDHKSGKASQATMEKNARPLSEQIGGLLNPRWVEWLMSWPIGWTCCVLSGTDKSLRRHQRRLSRSGKK